MFGYGRVPQGKALASAGLCLLTLGPFSAIAEPIDSGNSTFEDRFSTGGFLAPTFTRPEVIQLLSGISPLVSNDESVGSAQRHSDEPYRPRQIAFAEPKGPAKVLKDLIGTPLKELLVSRAEAGSEEQANSAKAQESTSTPSRPAPSSPESASVQPRAAEPLAERPAADNIASVPAQPAAREGSVQQPPPKQRPPTAPDVAIALPPPPAPPDIRVPQESTPSTRLATAPAQSQPHQPPTLAPSRVGGPEQEGISPKPPEPAGPLERERWIGKGYAAWYQHPGRTASGETFNPDELTASHRTLPFGTHVRVVDERTGRSVAVRINDRVPRKATIAIDLSRAAARSIGLTGVARVSMYQVEPATVTASLETDRAQPARVQRAPSRLQARKRDLPEGSTRTRVASVSTRTTIASTKSRSAKVDQSGSPRTALPRAANSASRERGSDTHLNAAVNADSDRLAPVSLPPDLAPTAWGHSGPQKGAYVRDMGWVRGTDEVIKDIHQPLEPVAEKALKSVSACAQGILEVARRHGAVRSEATSAGPQRRGRDATTLPVEVRLTYAGWIDYEARQAKVGCDLDGAGRVVRIKSRS